MTYRVVLIESDEGFAVGCPALPGCWSQGATREEALANIRDAIALWLEVQDEDMGREMDAEGVHYMHAVEFTTELSDSRTLPIPQEVADQLPKTGRARIIVLTDELTGAAEWRSGAYQQFLRDDAPEDAIYDSCR